MSLLKHFWQIFRRKLPYGILTWHSLSLGKIDPVRNRLFCFSAYRKLPRVIWFFISIFNLGRWFCFQGWIMLWKSWKRNSSILLKHFGVSRSKQLIDLWKLVFLQSTPPVFYYTYRLYLYPTNDWLNFIYTHELPAWHYAMSPRISQRTISLLSDKAAFAIEMKKHGLPTVDGQVILKGKGNLQEVLLKKTSVFLKPLAGSQKIDAYALEYNTTTSSYQLALSADEVINEKEQIVSFFQTLIDEKDFIIQPLLINHSSLNVLYSDVHLITIRLITIWAANKAKAISAVLEIPVDVYKNRVFALPINIESGKILPLEENIFTIRNDTISKVKHSYGHQLIYWNELLDVALKAHACFPDIFSVGWDFAITPEGVKLIEGNINWAVAPHQLNGPKLMPYFIKFAKLNIN